MEKPNHSSLYLAIILSFITLRYGEPLYEIAKAYANPANTAHLLSIANNGINLTNVARQQSSTFRDIEAGITETVADLDGMAEVTGTVASLSGVVGCDTCVQHLTNITCELRTVSALIKKHLRDRFWNFDPQAVDCSAHEALQEAFLKGDEDGDGKINPQERTKKLERIEPFYDITVNEL